jgi:predicted HicB family RNase H-like nuclease
MTTKKIHRGLRLEPVLSARCDAMASEKQLSFSEWARQVLRKATHQSGVKR